MDDLISRNKVIDVLKQTGIIQDNDLGHLVVEEIERIPTAYDVDKVVEQLTEMEDKAMKVKNITVSSYACGMMHKAIEIVRKGGVE